MAQTNYTPIQLYYSTTASAVPVNTNLASGELAINIADGLLFYKDNLGAVQKIGYKLTPTTAGGTGLTSFTNGGIVYASSTSALATGSALTFDGTTFQYTGAANFATSTGSVAIGTNSPASLTKLTIVQDSTYGVQLMNATQNYTFRIDSGNSNAFTFGNRTSFTDLLTISTGGAVGIGYTSLTSVGNNGLAVLGNVGIGTSSPSTKLDISGTLRIDATSNIYGKADNTSFVSLYGGGAYNQGAGIGLGGTSQATNPNVIIFTRGNYVETARFDASGNLGIGTTSPLSKLSVAQGADGFDQGITLSRAGANRGTIFLNASNDTLNFGRSTATSMSLDASGNLGLGVTPYSNGTFRYIDVALYASFGQQIGGSSGVNIGWNAAGGASLNTWNYKRTGDVARLLEIDTSGFKFFNAPSGTAGTAITFTQAMTLDASGNLLVGVTSASGSTHEIFKSTTLASKQLIVGPYDSAVFYAGNSSTANAAAAVLKLIQASTTSRSINAAGSINASGTDYAEYMTKSGDFIVDKGDVVGIDKYGKLTNVFDKSVSFAVKSTNPAYVGGDTWGSGFDDNAEGLEAARQTVDRIAFAGQVPVNVIGATAGQYIIPVNNNGAIKGEAVNEADMTLSQYMKAVGKVIAIESDGRAKIIVKVA